jgi:hypothetical protein
MKKKDISIAVPIVVDQLPCIHKFTKEVQWLFEGAAIKRLICTECKFRLFYVDPVAKEADYKWAQGGNK